MFNKNYPFYTSSSRFMIKHFENFSKMLKKYLKKNSILLEIGSNVNIFKKFQKLSIGFEPKKCSQNCCQKGLKSYNEFLT